MKYALAGYLLLPVYLLGIFMGWAWGILGMLGVLGWMWFPYGLLPESHRRRWHPFFVMFTVGLVLLTLLFLFVLHPPQIPECPPCQVIYCTG